MAVLLLLLLVASSAMLGAFWALEYMKANRPEREAALAAELEALRSAQTLSIKAWQARHAMAEVVRQVGRSHGGSKE
jgi:outer membrane lipoprotein-sorting protein